MPILGDVLTESTTVTLDANESSPYKPPHRPSNEKPSSQSSGTTEAGIWHLNGKITENNIGNSYFDRVFSHGEGRTSNSLHSLPNGRSSESSEGQHRPGSKNESSFSIVSGLGSVENMQKPSGPPNGIAKNGIKNQPPELAQVNGSVTQPLRKTTLEHNTPLNYPRSPSRPHSASVPIVRHRRSASEHVSQGSSHQPSPNADSSKGDAPSQTTNRFSLPPVYPPPSTAASGLSPANSITTPQHPGLTQLRHRHTLQVPKTSTNRGSRDFSFQYGNAPEDAFSSSIANSTGGARRGSLSLVRRNTRSIHSDLYLEEVPQDGDVARWTETVRQKRASRRKRKEEEEDDRVMVGTKVDVNHVNWVTAYNMLTGIRFTVSRTNAKLDRELMDQDFDARHKFSFDITGNELTPSARYDFKFKDYAPWVFRHLRAMFKLDPADYLISLTSKYILSELGSPGKSGSFFYFSRDYKYIIKTIHQAEHKLLRKVLRDYYTHVQNNPNTLISQFYGLHRVKIPYGRKIHFVVMNNLFPPHRDIHQIFDLKGSTVGRDLKEDDLEKNPKATRATLKDLNWLRRNKHLEFGPQKKHVFIDQMKKDVALLQRLKIMDYSLLVGIHDVGRGNEENLRDKTLQVFQPGVDHAEEASSNLLTRSPSKVENARKARELRHIIQRERPVPMDKSTNKMPEEMLEERKDFFFYSDDGGFRATHEDGQPGEEIYYLGIIDCLTHYGFVKKAEHFWKSLSHDKTQISPVAPEGYGERFIKFISGITMTKEEAEKTNHDQQIDGSIHANRLSTQHPSRSSGDQFMEKADRQVQRSNDRGGAEDEAHDRTLSTMRSSSAERSNGIPGLTLPVVEEAGENNSTGGHSSQSRERDYRSHNSSSSPEAYLPALEFSPLGGRPPPTPPKDHPPPGS